MELSHRVQVITILMGVAGIVFTAVAVSDQIDALGLQDIEATLMVHDDRITNLEINESATFAQLANLEEELSVIRDDTRWIRQHLIDNP